MGPTHERGPAHLWLRGQSGLRSALRTLWAYAQDSLRYHGGVHVDGRHIVAIFDDDGSELYPMTSVAEGVSMARYTP